MNLQNFHIPGLSINSYLIGDSKTKKAVMIDPTREVDPYLRYAEEEGYQITDIVETHVHADFVSGSKELKYRLKGKPIIHCSAMGGPQWIPAYADKPVQSGDRIDLGSCCLQALHTPGHTPEHLIWLCFDKTRSSEVPCLAFTGDLLFVGSVGRPDLLGNDETKKLAQQLYQSLFIELAKLPDFLEIFPGHGAGSLCGKGLSSRPTTTLGYERLFNPYLQQQTKEKWIEELQKGIPAAPINFQRLKKINVEGPPLLNSPVATDETQILFIDARGVEAFAKAHIKGAIHVPWGSNFCNWIGSFINEDFPLGIVVEKLEQLPEIKKNLRLIGLDNVVKEIAWNETTLKSDYPIDSLTQMNVESLSEQISKKDIVVLDVRTPGEWETGYIKEAFLLELSHVASNLHKIPRDKPIHVICGSGFRASLAASYLKNHGFKEVVNVRGGMSAWHKAKLPVIKNAEKDSIARY